MVSSGILLFIVGVATFWAPALLRRRLPWSEFWLTALSIPVAALAGTGLLVLVRPSTIDNFLASVIDKFFVGGAVGALAWLAIRGSALARSHALPFPPVALVAVPASAWLLLQLIQPWMAFGYWWPMVVAFAQIVVLIGAWWKSAPDSAREGVAPTDDVETVGAPLSIRPLGMPRSSEPVAEPVAAKPHIVPPVVEAPQARTAPPPAAAAAAPSPPQPAKKPAAARLFISYRRDDSAYIADRISEKLTQRFGREAVFKDVDSIPLGQDFRTHLRDAVGQCDVLMAIIGREWLLVRGEDGERRLDDPRDSVRIEIESALERNIPVIPVLVQGAPVPKEKDLPETLKALSYRNAQPVRPDPDFATDLERLMRGIEAQLR